MIDAHLHVWDRARLRYDWLEGALDRDSRFEQALPLLRAHRAHGCVLIEAHGSHEEARWLLEIADQFDPILGVVAGLGTGAHETLRLKHPKLKGVRVKIWSGADWNALESTLERVAANGWSCDLLLLESSIPTQLPQVCARHPSVRFVLDHLAGARVTQGQHAAWAKETSAFRTLEHVAVKLSGFLTAAPGAPLETTRLAPFVNTALEAFGAERLIYGSDYPICTLRGGYGDTVRMLEACVKQLGMDEREAIWHETAMRVYGLEIRASDVR